MSFKEKLAYGLDLCTGIILLNESEFNNLLVIGKRIKKFMCTNQHNIDFED